MNYSLDWSSIFSLDKPLSEIMLRGTLMYLGIFTLLRLILRREAGNIEASDILLMVLIADASQNGMTGEYKSVTLGLILIAILIFWTFLLDFIPYKFPVIERLIRQPPVYLIKDGKVISKNLRKEMITRSELSAILRKSGVEEIQKVAHAVIESDDSVSVITNQ